MLSLIHIFSKWLEGQLGDLRKQSEELQSKVVALQQGSGIFGVGGTDPQGKPVIYSPVPVSYTHLDVYKRQPSTGATPTDYQQGI